MLYSRRGPSNGLPMVLLHGVIRSHRCFTPLLADLERAWEVHGVDHAGHGDSPRANRYRVVDYASPVVEYLEERVSAPAVIYGHSLGAMVAAVAAAQTPERVRALVLEDPPFETMGARIAGSGMQPYFASLKPFAGRPFDPRGLSKVIGAVRDASTIRFMARCLSYLDPAVLDPIVIGEWLQGFDLEDTFRRIACPILLLQSDPAAGGMLTPEDAARVSAAAADCTLVHLQGIGHQAHWLDTQTLLRHLHAFLLTL